MMRFLFLASDGIYRTGLGAHTATDTHILPDEKSQQFIADFGRALLVVDMGFILMTEIFDSTEDRIRGRHTKSAETGIPYILGQGLEQLNIAFLPLTLSDPGQDLEETLSPDPAGNALAAGL